MNAPRSFIRATMAPASLAAAIGLAFAMSAPAQAQYTYPGTASSSGHYASSIHPIRAGARERSTQVARPMPAQRPQRAMAAMNGGYGNPSMRRGEACPPGSNCGMPTSGGQQSNGGGPAPSAGYGGQARYGYGGQAAGSVHPVQAGGSASISPVRAGVAHGAVNYGTSQNATGYRNAVTGNSSGPSTHVSGQENSFTGPNGKVSMGNSQVTGPNGEKVGQQSPGGKYGGGYGQQKNSGVGYGNSFTDGSGSMRQTGNAPGMANANGMNMNNGGAAGAEDSADGGKNVKGWDKNPDGSQKQKGTLDTFFDGAKSLGNSLVKKIDDLTSSGPPPATDMKPGETRPVGPPKRGGGSKDEADTGGTSGPGEVVSGTGQVVRLGKPGGQDTGGGQGKDAGGSGSGDNKNATGQYATSNTPLSGQDAPIKPKEQGVLKVNYNGKNGVTDPKLNGSNGGGG